MKQVERTTTNPQRRAQPPRKPKDLPPPKRVERSVTMPNPSKGEATNA